VACRVQTEKTQHSIKENVMIPNKKPWSVFSHKTSRGVSIEEVPGDEKEFCLTHFPEISRSHWFEFDGVQRGEAEISGVLNLSSARCSTSVLAIHWLSLMSRRTSPELRT
jgi:hypothetical protein